jgi:hypothetical protein
MYISIEEYEETKAFLAQAEKTVAGIQARLIAARRQFADDPKFMKELDAQQEFLDARIEHLTVIQNQLSGFVN